MMKKMIAFMLTLILALTACCTAGLAVSLPLATQNGVELELNRIQMGGQFDKNPSVRLGISMFNRNDFPVELELKDIQVDGYPFYNEDLLRTKPNDHNNTTFYCRSSTGDDAGKNAAVKGKSAELRMVVRNSDTGEELISERITLDLSWSPVTHKRPTEASDETLSILNKLNSPTQPAAGATNARAGEIITFGHYDQDGNVGNGVEPIDWQILATNGNMAFVVSRCGLFNAKYTEHSKGQQWENCDLRKTLNSSFYYEAFTPAERDAIQLTTVDNSEAQGDPSAVSYRGYGNNTEDYIYILSYGELVNYLPTQNDRVCEICQKGKDKGLCGPEYVFGMRTCNYWLRHPVYKQNAGGVTWSGTIASAYMNFGSCMVRPCCWVNLTALGY